MSPAGIDAKLRARLVAVADALIPGADGMPAPSSIDLAGRQLDVVLESRPDLAGALRRALDAAGDADDPIGWVEALRVDDPTGYEALVTAIVGGYYLHADVKRLLGYPGQSPRAVEHGALPDYVEEGLLERAYGRGPIYRPTPPG